MASLVASFPLGLALIRDRISGAITAERDFMRKGLARRALLRKNYCVLKDMSDGDMARLGFQAREIAEVKEKSQ